MTLNASGNLTLYARDITGSTNIVSKTASANGTYVLEFTALSTSTQLQILNTSGATRDFYTDDLLIEDITTGGYLADVMQSQDYSPFGVVLDGRHFTVGDDYRYSFQGQEHDDEIKGAGNSINFEYRMYDPRIGRFLSLDRFSKYNSSVSPYAFASNCPINAIDKDGLYTIFVNGYTGSGAQPYKPYWQEAGTMPGRDKNEYINAAHAVFGDGIGQYVDGSGSSIFSMAWTRQSYGRAIAGDIAAEIKKAIENGEDIKEINFVTHSMGAATAEGIIEVLMEDPILAPLIKNGQIVHFSPADADGIVISDNSKELDRIQINYTGDITITEQADINSPDEDGGYIISGVKKIGIVNADVDVLHPNYDDSEERWNFHMDTKSFKEAWNAVRYVERELKNKPKGGKVRISSKEIQNYNETPSLGDLLDN